MSECIITRRGGGAFSTLPTLNENYPEDKSITFISGNTATASFEVKIDVDGKLAEYTYQWYIDGQPINGANSASYTWSGTTGGTHSVYCDVTNDAGTVVSRAATLSVVMYYKPVLNPNYPADYSGMQSNSMLHMEVKIVEHGCPTEYTYKWFIDGSPRENWSNDWFDYGLMNSVGTHYAYCEVTNKAGTVRSRTATITIMNTYLYYRGDQVTNKTGGWQMTKALPPENTGYSLGNFYNSDTLRMHLWSNQGHDGFVATRNKIDLTHYSKIRFVVSYTFNNDDAYKLYFVATSINNTAGAINGIVAQTATTLQESTNTSWREYYVDVSSVQGSYYIGFLSWIWVGETDVRVSEVNLVP